MKPRLPFRLGSTSYVYPADILPNVMNKARRVIRSTRRLNPWAYVIHLDGTDLRSDASPAALARWRDQATLDLLPDGVLAQLLDLLLADRYQGVLTLEVFTERHFFPSQELILSLMEARL